MISLDVVRWTVEPHENGARLILDIPKAKAGLLLPEGSRLSVTVQKHRERRSLNANAYCWKLCDEIARAIGSAKDDIYRMAIQEVGVFDSIRIRKEAAPRFIAGWEEKGTGWVAVKAGEDMRCAYINAYYGSSTYDTAQMARLIDWLIEEAQVVCIDTLTPAERALMLEEWGS